MKPVFALLILSLTLAACGVKGDLKRPSEIQQEEQQNKAKGKDPLPHTPGDTTL